MSVVVEGIGLFSGRASRVALSRCEGDVVVRKEGESARVRELVAVGTERCTTVARGDGAVRIATVEHLFAALAGLGVYAGVSIEVFGDELPILDGGAAEWARAIGRLEVAPGEPSLVVVEAEEIALGTSVYAFRPGARDLAVRFESGDSRLARDASWSGGADDFARRIAPARTFALARDLAEIAARGLASHVPPASVVVVTEDAIHASGAPFAADEPARHKLLDLAGDLYLYGGPPKGALSATRPGHAATHEAVRRALAQGVLTRREARG